MLGDELEHVQVAGQDRRLEVRGLGLADERRDDVVGLEALHLVDRDAERRDDPPHLGDLLAHLVGHARPRRLVLGEPLVPERRRGQVEGDRHVRRADVLEGPQHDVREPEHGRNELALRGRERLLDEGEVSAVDEPVAVEQHQAIHRQASGRTRTGRRGTRPQCTRERAGKPAPERVGVRCRDGGGRPRERRTGRRRRAA